jgi:hypothetical protein
MLGVDKNGKEMDQRQGLLAFVCFIGVCEERAIFLGCILADEEFLFLYIFPIDKDV